ncbi:unnamed protein product [Cladocopium goreaui]|uniref:Pentatricopeptide repeat-containing protein At2g41720 (Protein EMBRYO DEFECTIVE 2654) n=1 Tax=Cladocopium goreaui TaxID=2562237 RepID=A0A9P1GSX3_9DINO|nr:unnamed protein product [Cladocopium goreaui]
MDGIVVNSAIRACEQAAQWTIALHLLQRLVRGLAPPQVASFNTAAAACASAMQWQRSLWLIFEELPHKMKEQPNMISFNVAISACEKGSKWATALALMEAMTRRQLETTVSSYGALAASYEKAAKGLQALRLLERMRKADPLLKLDESGQCWVRVKSQMVSVGPSTRHNCTQQLNVGLGWPGITKPNRLGGVGLAVSR